ncbi:MAG: cupin domain-containing protein [Lachnospiraceae bacterium]|nr:cupin domain-containing protein [Lachnospiraceae bacterium]
MLIRKEDQPVAVREHVQKGAGAVSFRYFLEEKDAAGTGRLFGVLTIPPGASIGPHTHEGEFELYYILSGEGVVTDNDETYVMREGDMMQCKSGNSHAVVNEGTEDLVFVAIILNDKSGEA